MKMDHNNNLPLKFILAENAATEILEKYGVDSPEHIRLRDIAFKENAKVIEAQVARATASLVRTKKGATIRVSPNDLPERQRFSIAHELGHFKLNHATGSLQKVCTKRDMLSWYEKSIETEANFFASELLLPKKLVEKMCDVAEVNFNPVQEIKEKFRVSLTAAAIKFVRLTPENCYIIFSENGIIRWSYRSSNELPFIHQGQPLDNRTGAYDFFQSEELDPDPIDVEADAWISSSRGIETVVEHSIGSKHFDFVLSLLWIKPD